MKSQFFISSFIFAMPSPTVVTTLSLLDIIYITCGIACGGGQYVLFIVVHTIIILVMRLVPNCRKDSMAACI